MTDANRLMPPLPPGFILRAAVQADAAGIGAVLHRVRREFGVLDENGTADDGLDYLEANYFAPGGTFLVVAEAEGGRLVGCAALRPLDDQRAELGQMYLESSARGKGIGKRLLEELLAVARRGAFTEVWLETNSVLTAALGLYKSYGFQPVPPDGLRSRCDQAWLLRLE